MSMRCDASYAASRLAIAVRELTAEIPGLRGTVGSVDLKPNLVNVIPREAVVSVDIRNANRTDLVAAQKKLDSIIQDIAKREGLKVEIEQLVRFDPVVFDPKLVQRIELAALGAGCSVRRMVSGAGHDAQMMARVCPAAMIFVPSINGISHNAAEATRQRDLIAGIEVLSEVVNQLT